MNSVYLPLRTFNPLLKWLRCASDAKQVGGTLCMDAERLLATKTSHSAGSSLKDRTSID